MVDGFQVGKYYRWIGPHDYCISWNQSMEMWKDGVPRRCIETSASNPLITVTFTNMCGSWDYRKCNDHFEEVDPTQYDEIVKSAINELKNKYLKGIYMQYTDPEAYK